jgi:hypothetical protein
MNKDRAKEIAELHFPGMGWTTKTTDGVSYVCSPTDLRVDVWDLAASKQVIEEVTAALVSASGPGPVDVVVAVEADSGDWWLASDAGLEIVDGFSLPFEPKFRQPPTQIGRRG